MQQWTGGRRRGGPAARRGSVAAEFVLLAPVVIALLLAMVQFSMALTARQQLLAASREGARVAALGGDRHDVAAAVRQTLGGGPLGQCEVCVMDGTGCPVAGGHEVPTGETVAVCVRLPTRKAVPDLLRFIGYSIKDEVIVVRTAMRRE
jgi:hypothetical protein